MFSRVYAAQPREGTETCREGEEIMFDMHRQVYADQPREGTETSTLIIAFLFDDI